MCNLRLAHLPADNNDSRCLSQSHYKPRGRYPDTRRWTSALCVGLSSTETESVGVLTYDLVAVTAVNTSTAGLLDGATVVKLNFWIHAVLIKMIPCLLLTVFGCLLVATVRESRRRAISLHSAGARVGGANMSRASNRRLKERNRTTVRQIYEIVSTQDDRI